MRLIVLHTIFTTYVAYVTSECLRGILVLDPHNKCPTKCYNNSCNGTTGLCKDGCLGFSNPPMCDKICRCGFFGKNCTEECPLKCRDRNCHIFTGNCHQCMDGYSGDRCTEEKFSTGAIIAFLLDV